MTGYLRCTPHSIEQATFTVQGVTGITSYAHLRLTISDRPLPSKEDGCTNCQYFSGSPYLKCAVNPAKDIGSKCSHFQLPPVGHPTGRLSKSVDN